MIALTNNNFMPLFPAAVKIKVTLAISSYLEWRGGLCDEAIAISEAEKQACHSRICSELVEMCGKAGLAEILSFVDSVFSSKNLSRAKLLPRPAAVVCGNRKTPTQRRILQLIGQLFELAECKYGPRLTWLSGIERDLQITRRLTCPLCGGQGIHTLNRARNGRYVCSDCKHRLSYPINELVDRCGCVGCEMKRRTLLIVLRDAVRAIESDRLMEINKFILNLSANQRVRLSDEQMRIDCKLNENNIGKDLRAILSLGPKSGEAFIALVHSYLEIHKGDFDQIFRSAIKAKILYSLPEWATTVSNCQTFYEAIARCSHFRVRTDAPIGGKWVGWSSDKEFVCDIVRTVFNEDEEVVARGLCFSADNSLCFRSQSLTVYLIDQPDYFLQAEIAAERKDGYFLNPSFSVSPSDKPSFSSDVARSYNLFRSNTEKNAHARLLQQHPKCLVVPNRLIRQIVDLERILPQLDPMERKYPWNCEVDFAVYGSDGDILFVEEVQRGDHHNDPEWIKKDAIKRKVLKIAGIKLVESF